MENIYEALELLRKKAIEAENYKKIAEKQQSVSMERYFEIKSLKAEIERLNEENKILSIKENMAFQNDLAKLNLISSKSAEIEKLEAFKSYFDELYGQGLDIVNWELDGKLEPFDNFYESALQVMEKRRKANKTNDGGNQMRTCKDCLHYELCEAKMEVSTICPSDCGYYTANAEWLHLPCKIGGTFYGIFNKTVSAYECVGIKYGHDAIILIAVYGLEFLLGEEGFLTSEEAEKALAEMEEKSWK